MLHLAQRGPPFNACLSAGRDPGSVLYGKLGPVPGFSGGVKVFCYTGFALYLTCFSKNVYLACCNWSSTRQTLVFWVGFFLT